MGAAADLLGGKDQKSGGPQEAGRAAEDGRGSSRTTRNLLDFHLCKAREEEDGAGPCGERASNVAFDGDGSLDPVPGRGNNSGAAVSDGVPEKTRFGGRGEELARPPARVTPAAGSRRYCLNRYDAALRGRLMNEVGGDPPTPRGAAPNSGVSKYGTTTIKRLAHGPPRKLRGGNQRF